MTQNRKRKQFLICITDCILLCVVLYPVLLLRKASRPEISSYLNHLNDFFPIIICWITVQYIAGLYALEESYKNIISAVKIASASLCSLFFGFTWFYLVPNSQLTPKTILALFCLAGFFAVYLWRILFSVLFLQFVHHSAIGVIGISSVLNELITYSKKTSFMGYTIAGIFDENEKNNTHQGIHVYTNFEEFMEFIKENNVFQIVVINQKDLSVKVQKNLFTLLENRVHFVSVTQFYETYIRKIPLAAINEVWFLQQFDFNNRKIYVTIKRFFDFLSALIFFTLSLPFYPFIILAVKLESSGPAFFRQVRTGYLGRQFTLYKFRTMTVSGNTFKPTEKHDVRITKLGNFMRKTRIDEIPQLINVLLGDMSIIGPRPERPELIVDLETKIPFYKQRLLVKPGITGWDQVSGEYHSPSIEDTYKKLQYDLYYIKNMSPLLDVSILAKTIKTVLVRGGR